MTCRYVLKPPTSYETDRPQHLDASMTVLEIDRSPIETGLVDQNGNKICREPERVKMGFWPK